MWRLLVNRAKARIRWRRDYPCGAWCFTRMELDISNIWDMCGAARMCMSISPALLNDVLKSLTVLDLSGGQISGVDYNSEAPLARRLATLRLTLVENPTMADFLGAL